MEFNARQRLVNHVHELERLTEIKQHAADALKDGFARAKGEGYDTITLKVVLKLRNMTPTQRQERKALEAIYLAALEMLDGDPLPDEARRRLDRRHDDVEQESQPDSGTSDTTPHGPDSAAPEPAQQPLIVKDPNEARQEGVDAAQAGRRIYDNPYPAGDACRAAWDEGWCAANKSHGMETPEAYRRKSPEKDDKDAGHGDPGKKGGDA